MRYFVSKLALSSTFRMEISEERFRLLKKSKEFLLAALTLEENYELLILNYIDFEKENLSVTFDRMVRSDRGYAPLYDVRMRLNRRLVNLLTSTKLYIDHALKKISTFDVCGQDRFKRLASSKYDCCFEYRLYEALRNYVQHRGLPIHSTSIGGRWIESDKSDSKLEHQTSIFVHKDRVEGDSKFKSAVAKEMPDKVDLIYAARVYMERLSELHDAARDMVRDVVAQSREAILVALSEFEELSGERPIGTTVSACDDEGSSVIDSFQILLDWDDIRIQLEEINGPLRNISKRYVSGAV